MDVLRDRYQRRAAVYDRFWGHVLAPSSRAVLDELGDRLGPDGAGRTVLDVGCGTGVLTVELLRRWPRLRVVALDLAPAMLEAARERVGAELGSGAADRARWIAGPAVDLPELLGPDGGTVDAAVSSFVLQIVPDRPAALRAIRASLRPGGRLALVIWQVDDAPFAPADAFDEAVVEARIDEPDEPPDGRSGPVPSAAAMAAQLRRAGFRGVGAREATLDFTWDAESYLALKMHYEEEGLTRRLDAAARARLEAAAQRRLSVLPAEAFRWPRPIVYAWGERPA
ncbi:MAG TPA: methyltransferase domain-containing protein [Candidatus Limnocylindrales bacterium]|nr:methyltransferase domain-containing protein [Candidatus Limnocylindrales bacterium]